MVFIALKIKYRKLHNKKTFNGDKKIYIKDISIKKNLFKQFQTKNSNKIALCKVKKPSQNCILK